MITGAGCSASSGIPTYRNKQAEWQRNPPIRHQAFLQDPLSRQRYWARSYAGWPAVDSAKPNTNHCALTKLEQQGLIDLLVTQNVDRLHQKAGHQQVIDLHGRLDRVQCQDCHHLLERQTMQSTLAELNSDLVLAVNQLAPDGDAEIEDALTRHFRIPDCDHCGGILKPDVVFYGGSVNRTLVEKIYTKLEQVKGILVVGSSLMVFSAYRFCRRAHECNIPIAILNDGVTRADPIASLKISDSCEEHLTAIVR